MKTIASVVLAAIQIAMLLSLMVWSQVVAMRVMIMCFSNNCHKGTFGSFIATFLTAVLCGVMLWMILLILDKYKVMLFGDSLTYRNSGKMVIKKLPKLFVRAYPSTNLWVPINKHVSLKSINWNGIVFFVADDGEICLTCGNLDFWIGDEPENLLGDEENPAFKEETRREFTKTGREHLLNFAGYFNLVLEAEELFRGYLSAPENYVFDRYDRLVVLERHNFLLIYENGFLKVLSYHGFIYDCSDSTYRSCSGIREIRIDCNGNRTKRYLKIGVPLKYIVNLDRCYFTDCRLFFDEIDNKNCSM